MPSRLVQFQPTLKFKAGCGDLVITRNIANPGYFPHATVGARSRSSRQNILYIQGTDVSIPRGNQEFFSSGMCPFVDCFDVVLC